MPLGIILLNHLRLVIVLVETLIGAIQLTLCILIKLVPSQVDFFDVKFSMFSYDLIILLWEFKVIIEVHMVRHVAIVIAIYICVLS